MRGHVPHHISDSPMWCIVYQMIEDRKDAINAVQKDETALSEGRPRRIQEKCNVPGVGRLSNERLDTVCNVRSIDREFDNVCGKGDAEKRVDVIEVMAEEGR